MKSFSIILMAVLTIYRIEYTNRENVPVLIQIQDRQGYDPLDTPTVQYIDLVGGAQPLLIECFPNNEHDSIFGDGIMGKRATISFKCTAQYGISTFSSGDDRRFLVIASYTHTTLGDRIIFEGWLVMDGNREQYVPHGQDVFLVANCGLGTMDGIELSDLDGESIDPDIPLTRIKYLAYVLGKTNLGLRINVVDNLYNGLMVYRTADPGDIKNNPWDQSWLLPKTFEKEVNEYMDSKEVLRMLQNRFYRTYQYNGEWWFVREAEKKLYAISYTEFTNSGVANDGFIDDTDHVVTIGHASVKDNYFINRSTSVEIKRPCKHGRAEFMFTVPKDIPRNKDFIRGDFFIDLSATEKAYSIDDWTYQRWKPYGATPLAATGSAFIKRVFENDYEKERYLVIQNTVDVNPSNCLRCKKHIFVHEKDRIKINIDLRHNTQFNDDRLVQPIAIELRANDGTFYYLNSADYINGSWFQYPTGLQELVWLTFAYAQNGDPKTDWRSLSISDIQGVPKDGVIYVYLRGNDMSSSVTERHFQNLSLEYIPYINGSYKKYDGERITNTRNGVLTFKPTHVLDECESPKILLQGALLNYDSGSDLITLLSNRWHDWSKTHAGYTEVIDKYLKLASVDMFDHYRKERRKMYVELSNLLYEGGHMDMHNLVLNSVESDHNKYKSFVWLDFRQDWMNCVMTGNIIEIDDNRDRYAEDYESEHKYIEG